MVICLKNTHNLGIESLCHMYGKLSIYAHVNDHTSLIAATTDYKQSLQFENLNKEK